MASTADSLKTARVDRRAMLVAAGGLTVLGSWRRSAAQDGWREGPPIPLARSELGAAVLDGMIYVVGGFGGGSRVDRLDPARGVWERVADLPVELHHPGVAALDGRLYVAGGYAGDTFAALPGAWAYDPTEDGWGAMPNLSPARGALGLAAFGGRLYAVGGAVARLGGPATDEVLSIAPGETAWRAQAPLPVAREHLAVAAAGDALYAVGGRANGDEGDAFAAAATAYDPARDAWTALPPLPTPRGGLSGTAVGDAVILLGGERGPRAFATVERYDPATGAWSALPPMPTARHGLASAVIGGTLFAMTGSTLAGSVENTPVVEVFALDATAPATVVGGR